ncbi:MAG: hypothetical protein HC936_04335 [Leptolyngbyaceae cyanobacterium SU_3_3]|nr:hypothetical protein [Leptolyngbyaceae cyanobacterium SU_3_3]NJR48966.1 hypothetical protein [Leptolyngbyaceae cyanobacterium CSU_1_3]
MVRTTSARSHLPTPRLLEKVLVSEQISRHEHLHLASILLSNREATQTERRQINRIFDSIQAGRLKLVD